MEVPLRDVRTISRLSRSASWVFQRNFINHQKPTNFRATWLRYNPMTVTLTSYPYFLSYVYAFLLYPSSSILLCLPFFCSYVYPYSSYAYFVPLLGGFPYFIPLLPLPPASNSPTFDVSCLNLHSLSVYLTANTNV